MAEKRSFCLAAEKGLDEALFFCYICINKLIQQYSNTNTAGDALPGEEQGSVWRIEENRPIWVQLTEQLAEQIIAGRYGPGERMPSVRELAAEAGVNPNTMQRAMAELEAMGLAQTNRTAGRVVTEDMEIIAQKRKETAGKQIQEFIRRMRNLGLSSEDILAAVEEEISKEG